MKRYAIGLITGILLTASAIMFMGATDKNLGDITVTSLKVVNKNDKTVVELQTIEDSGMLKVNNADGIMAAALVYGYDGGELALFNYDRYEPAVYLVSGPNGGVIETYNSDSKNTAFLGTSTDKDGGLIIQNKHGEDRGMLVIGNNGDGEIFINDHKGDVKWSTYGIK